MKPKYAMRVLELTTATALLAMLAAPSVEAADFATSTSNGNISVSVQSFQGAPISSSEVTPPAQMTETNPNPPTINATCSLSFTDSQPALGVQDVSINVVGYFSNGGGSYSHGTLGTWTYQISGDTTEPCSLVLPYDTIKVQFVSSTALVSNSSWTINSQSSTPAYIVDHNNGQKFVITNSTGQVALSSGAAYEGEIASGTTLNAPINTVIGSQNGPGYMLVGEDGSNFTFDVPNYGNTYSDGITGLSGSRPLAGPIVGGQFTPGDQGYTWFAADGGVFAFGNAGYYGSAAEPKFCWNGSGLSGSPCASGGLPADVVGGALTYNGQGYWLLLSDGVVLPFGNAVNLAPITGYLTDATGAQVPYQGFGVGTYPAGTFGISMPCWTSCVAGFYDGGIMAQPGGDSFVIMSGNGITAAFGCDISAPNCPSGSAQPYNYGLPNSSNPLGAGGGFPDLIATDMVEGPGYSRVYIANGCIYTIGPDEESGCVTSWPGGQVTAAAGVLE